ncbi:MAG: alpha-E domain-containing protein [Isosphaerales bacterium]
MLSRVAENLFWMSRYLERAENVARLLDVGLYIELDAPSAAAEDGSAPVEIALNILDSSDSFRATHPVAERTELLGLLTFDRANPHSILSMIALARENARGTQESLGVDAWSEVNRLYLYLCSKRAQRRFQAGPSAFCSTIKQSCILFDGLVQNSLPRDEVYHFLQVGRYLERVHVMGRILHAKCRSHTQGTSGGDPAMELVRWTGLLRSCSAYGAYLRVERDRVEPVGVIRFLVLNPDFPRAIRFCVARCRDSLQEIAGGDDDEYASEAERLLGRLDGELHYINVGEIFERGLLAFLDRIETTCLRVGEEIQRSYFLT